MKVYLDACCVNRLTDDQSQPRIRAESEAIEQILRNVRKGTCQWLGSEALIEEIEGNPDTARKRESRALISLTNELIQMTDPVLERARQLQTAGYGGFDAIHLASAESGHADVLLTMDDRFLRRAERGLGTPLVSVRNPISWLEEERSDDRHRNDD